MAIIKCKMCGGDLNVMKSATTVEREFCGSLQTIPKLDDEKRLALFTRANRLRSACEFDKAYGVYESIVAESEDEAEAYWGLILCKYGIEYVDDPKTAKKIPTCHRSSFDSIFDDPNFEMVMECAEPVARAIYREEAKVIEQLRTGIIEVSSKEEPYDIFICYKETDINGDRTIDSVIAQDVYDALTDKGYKVFFSRITLEDKLGQEYEPYIFAALNSAKIMLAFGTDYEHFNAVWVKNEWSRFLSLIERGEKKTLIPCYKDIDAYDMPTEFRRLQAQDMGKVGAIQDLVRGIGKILGTTIAQTNNVFGAASAEGSLLVQRGNMALEDGDFKGAEGHFERALDANPSDAYAYLGKFLALNCLKSLDDLDDKVCLEDNKEFRRAEQFADAKLANELKKVKELKAAKKERLRLINVLKKYSNKAVVLENEKKKEELENKKKTAYGYLMLGTTDGEKKAREIYAECLSTGLITETDYSSFIDRSYIVQAFAKVLSDYEMHDKFQIVSEYPLNKYVRVTALFVLEDLHRYGYAEVHGGYCCLAGAREEKERLLKESAPIVQLISDKYDSKIQSVQKETNEAIAEANRKRDHIQNSISELRSKQSSLGFFQGKEKKALQIQIDELVKNIDSTVSQQQLQSESQARIDKISEEKKQAIVKAIDEVRSKNTRPKE